MRTPDAPDIPVEDLSTRGNDTETSFDISYPNCSLQPFDDPAKYGKEHPSSKRWIGTWPRSETSKSRSDRSRAEPLACRHCARQRASSRPTSAG